MEKLKVKKNMITSTRNSKIQLVRSLLDKPRQRTEESAFVIEGVRLAEEALASGCLPKLVLYCNTLSERGKEIIKEWTNKGALVEEVSPKVMNTISNTETTQGILAICPHSRIPIPQKLDFVLIVDVLRDPGNLGTILRTAAAAGVQTVILTPGTTDAYAPKVLRSAMGAHFHLAIHNLNWKQIQALLKGDEDAQQTLCIYLADTQGGKPLWELDFKQPIALVIGGEAEGASKDAYQLCSGIVQIPMPGKSESLNAAAAAAVLLFEVIRQRSQ
jgi:TrmH family RNA methyltransferase